MQRDPDDQSRPPTGQAHVPEDASAPPRSVAIFFDLSTRDGRRAVEIRSTTSIANGFYASPRATVYSCSYQTQAERIVALRRAHLFCEVRGHRVVHVASASDRRAAWQ